MYKWERLWCGETGLPFSNPGECRMWIVDCGEVHDVTFDSTIIGIQSQSVSVITVMTLVSILRWLLAPTRNWHHYYHHRHRCHSHRLNRNCKIPDFNSIVYTFCFPSSESNYISWMHQMKKTTRNEWTNFCVLAMAKWFDRVHSVLLWFGNDLPINYCWRRQLNRFAGETMSIHGATIANYIMRTRCDFTDWIHLNLCQSKST